MNQNAFQLTKYPVGSKREFWIVTWPLMLGLWSWTLMMFIDRLFLARWNSLALNAVVTSGLAYYLVLVMPLAVVEISEVISGRLHGEERHPEIGSAVWQMVLLSIGLIPCFALIAWLAPFVLFVGSGNEEFETIYFRIVMLSAFLQCINISLLGFFIGIGSVKIVTYAAVVSNVAKLILDYWLIFGGMGIPPLGIAGAGMATVFAQVVQSIFIFSFYWSKTNKMKYGTLAIGFKKNFLFEGLHIGVPAGFARCLEIFAHFVFFRMVAWVSAEQMTLVAIAQSVYLVGSSIVDSQSKGAGAIVANLLGADQHGFLSHVLKSGFILHFFYFMMFLLLGTLFSNQIFNVFIPSHGIFYNITPEFIRIFKAEMFWVSIFFLFNGFAWILVGFLTAAKDTRYVFWVSFFSNWLAYIPAIVWFVGWKKGGADIAWMIVALVSGINLFFYLIRYFSGKWLTHTREHREDF